MILPKRTDNILLYVFLSVPVLSSIMSAIHLINLVELGNPVSMAIALAITFELGSIVSFVALSKKILRRLKKELLFFIFVILFLLQAFGNVYSSFDYIRHALLVDPTWLDSFREMMYNVMDVTSTKLTLALLIGLPIPIISLVLLKSAIDYFSTEEPAADAPTIPFDGRGNVIGAKTYDEPADISGRGPVKPRIATADYAGFKDIEKMEMEPVHVEQSQMEHFNEPAPENEPQVLPEAEAVPEAAASIQNAEIETEVASPAVVNDIADVKKEVPQDTAKKN